MQRFSGNTGYTVLELAISVGLIGILISIGLVSVRETLLTNRLRSEAQILAQAMTNFLGLAQIRDERLVLAIYPESFQIYRGALGGEVIIRHRFRGPIHASAPDGPITLAPSGAITPATIEIGWNGSVCRIVVALRGRTNIECDTVG